MGSLLDYTTKIIRYFKRGSLKENPGQLTSVETVYLQI